MFKDASASIRSYEKYASASARARDDEYGTSAERTGRKWIFARAKLQQKRGKNTRRIARVFLLARYLASCRAERAARG